MYRCATISHAEIDALRTIARVVRRGHVRHIGTHRIELDDGAIPTDPQQIHVNCACEGLASRPARPIFEAGRITPQPVRTCQPTFNAALVGFVEARDGDDSGKNRLCPPNPYPNHAVDWIANNVISQQAQSLWNADPDLSAWLETSRLDVGGGLRDHSTEPLMQSALTRYFEYAEPAARNLARLRA